MKKLLLALLLCIMPLSAQAQTSKSNIISDINGLFADNVQQLITAAFLRTVTTEIVSSYVDWITCTNAGGLIYYKTLGVPTCLPLGTAGQYLVAGGVSPSWQTLTTNLISGVVTQQVTVVSRLITAITTIP